MTIHISRNEKTVAEAITRGYVLDVINCMHCHASVI